MQGAPPPRPLGRTSPTIPAAGGRVNRRTFTSKTAAFSA